MKIVYLLILLGLYALSLYSCRAIGCYQCKDWFLENDVSTQYEGVVKNKYLDSNNRMTPMIKLDNSTEILIFNMGLYDAVDIGDSIRKNKGSLKYHLVKGGNQTVYYQQCCDENITDRDLK